MQAGGERKASFFRRSVYPEANSAALFFLTFSNATPNGTTRSFFFRHQVVDAFISYMLAGRDNAVVLDLCLRGLTKLASESLQDFASRICVSTNATGEIGAPRGLLAIRDHSHPPTAVNRTSPLAEFFKLLSTLVSPDLSAATEPSGSPTTPTSFDRGALAASMSLSLLSKLTRPSPSNVDLNNSKRMLCSLAFDGGVLDPVAGILNGAGRARRKKAKEDSKKNYSSFDEEEEARARED